MRMKRTGKMVITLVAVLLLVLTVACTPRQEELVEGVLQNVDSVNGEITIVTKDGKTVTLTIATEAPVETEGASSAIETLEPGASVEVEVNDDGQIARRIKAHQAKVEGTIVGIEGNEVTLESERGRRVTVLVTERTRIELEDDFPGTVADLHIGLEVEIKFDPESRVAFKIDTEKEEAEIEGIVVRIEANEVTIETERGYRRTLVITDATRIELEDDFPGTIADLQVGVEVEAKFDPSTRLAFKIEVEEEKVVTPTPTKEKVNLRFFISDEVNAIEDFEHLYVTITSIGLHKGGESGKWHLLDPIPDPDGDGIDGIDLKPLEGPNALIIWSGYVDPGEYTKVFIYVDNVTGILAASGDGETVDVKLPSKKLQISKPFTISSDSVVNFVYDITVVKAGKSGKYILQPQIAQSGPKQKFIEVTPPLTGEDTTPPVITLTGVTEGQVIVSPDTVTPIFSASDETDPEPTLTATLNGEEPFTSGTVVSETGEYELVVTAIDASDNEAEVAVNFEIVQE